LAITFVNDVGLVGMTSSCINVGETPLVMLTKATSASIVGVIVGTIVVARSGDGGGVCARESDCLQKWILNAQHIKTCRACLQTGFWDSGEILATRLALLPQKPLGPTLTSHHITEMATWTCSSRSRGQAQPQPVAAGFAERPTPPWSYTPMQGQ
jgi:hypothetical protein